MEVVAKKNNFANFDNELDARFIILAKETCAFLSTGGIQVKAYKEGLPHFSQLNIDAKEKVIHQLQFYRDLCEKQIEENYEIKDNHSFVWRAMKALGLTPTSDLFNYITDDNIVELYSPEDLQLFRNFKFFEVCSYSLEEMYSVEWWKLYQRDERVLTELIEVANNVRSGENKAGVKPKIVPHTVREIASDEKLNVELAYDWVAPVFKNKQIGGCITVARAHIIEN